MWRSSGPQGACAINARRLPEVTRRELDRPGRAGPWGEAIANPWTERRHTDRRSCRGQGQGSSVYIKSCILRSSRTSSSSGALVRPPGLPHGRRQRAGYQLYLVQMGLEPLDWKPIASVGPGCCEVRVRTARDAYRVLYVASIGKRCTSSTASRRRPARQPRPTSTSAGNATSR